ncbi:phosphorylated adapter RNA export protein [Corythoichthys intestinalis]|uniref:phosphorylated adapter RNA export protein n=1 Tax=Corythoichthys intestinalis TaxID=161448 RepID=UPI0025A52608|nr:phosphorylated adapter RNA export protein [Corythoichthys intestinalis]XP_061809144.1 phosphorylated adapter RNA export protein-like [Nerophis lumbriciformis]
MADGDVMDRDLEDGEISSSDSDSEMKTTTAAIVARPIEPAVFSGQSFQSRSAVSYRNASKPTSDSDLDSSDEEGASWSRKRQKVSQPALNRLPEALRGRRVNNIWGSVVQEQCQDAVAAELCVFGMDGEVSMDRNVETYNYVLAHKIKEKERQMEKREKHGEEVKMLDDQLDEYRRGEREGGDAKRKRPVKERLGPLAEMDVKGRYEITQDDPEDKVVDEIAYRLQEPKKELIQRAVNVLGNKKAIELLGETATLEENGGVYTVDGSRRRTPGGVYFNLLKNTPSVTRAQIREIFFDESQKEQKSKKAAQKRRRHLVAKKMKQAIGTLNLQEHDDVSRETFASDTNDALESLEDAGKEEEEDGVEEERAVGTEESPVVYNSADLEVF